MPALPFRLVPFESSPDTALGLEIAGKLARERDGLILTWSLRGETDQVKFAAPSPRPTRKDELWRTTCFELFVKPPDAPDYWEYNLAPSGDWNAYRLSGYRAGLQAEPEIADIRIDTELSGSNLAAVRATLPLPPRVQKLALSVGISSVIEDRSGVIHYYALRHAGSKPDFHDPAGFALVLDRDTN